MINKVGSTVFRVLGLHYIVFYLVPTITSAPSDCFNLNLTMRHLFFFFFHFLKIKSSWCLKKIAKKEHCHGFDWQWFWPLFLEVMVLRSWISPPLYVESKDWLSYYNLDMCPIKMTYAKKHKQTNKQTNKNPQVILSALCLPDFVTPRSLSTIYRCLLTTMPQDIPY